ncbi:hypothetical protein N7G274_006901 [Stereocaulon virgatum]|uniref:Uncharacterized protein n=1 Tax=Stereocaulon virgatum TaxID=373712 RepID=A0ABR4A5W7_9LECA
MSYPRESERGDSADGKLQARPMMTSSNLEITMSDAQHDRSSASDSDNSFSFNTHEASAVEPGLVTNNRTPISPGLPPTSTLKRTNAAACLDISMQGHGDQIEGEESSDAKPRLDPRSVRLPWYDPANFLLHQPPPRRKFYGRLEEEEDPQSCSGVSLCWRLREDHDGDLCLWIGKMRGNMEVYNLYEWSTDREGNKISKHVGWWDEDGNFAPGKHPSTSRQCNERQLVRGPDPRKPSLVSRTKPQELKNKSEDEDMNDGKALKQNVTKRLNAIFDRLALGSIWDSYYPDQKWTGYGSLD